MEYHCAKTRHPKEAITTMKRGRGQSTKLLTSDSREPPSEFRLFPLGKIKTSKGTFYLSEKDARACIKAHAAYGNDLSIDYGHGAYEEAYGQPQRAAGWIGGLELRADGLYAVRVSWTIAARSMIASRE